MRQYIIHQNRIRDNLLKVWTHRASPTTGMLKHEAVNQTQAHTGLFNKAKMGLFIKGMGTLGPFIKHGTDACWLLQIHTQMHYRVKVLDNMLRGIVKMQIHARSVNAGALLK